MIKFDILGFLTIVKNKVSKIELTIWHKNLCRIEKSGVLMAMGLQMDGEIVLEMRIHERNSQFCILGDWN